MTSDERMNSGGLDGSARSARAPKALVLGRDARSFLAVIRSLGRRGVDVHVTWCPPESVALRSRYVTQAHELPEPDEEGRWLEFYERLVLRERFDLVMPTHDPSVMALQIERHSVAALAPTYLLGERAFAVCYDKLATRALAHSLGLPVPDERRVETLDDLSGAGE